MTESEPSFEWLLPLWAKPKLQSRGCVKPGARSRSKNSLLWSFISSSAYPCPSFQTPKLQLKCITTFSLMFPQQGSHFPPLLCLIFSSSIIKLFLLLLLSCPQLCLSVVHTICPFKTLLLWSLSTILTMESITGTLNPFISLSHFTASDSHLTPLRMPWTSFPCLSCFVLY